MMDPSAIIAAALNNGVAAVSARTASDAVVKAYQRLRSALLARLADKAAVMALFNEVEAHPESADILVHQVLRHERGRIDDELYQRAMELLETLSDSGDGQRSVRVDVRSSQGVQIGDHNVQTNTFSVGEAESR